MSDLENQIEKLLRSNSSSAPQHLRGEVERVVVQSLKRQTLIDDAKWLALCASVLLSVVVGHWMLLQRGDLRLQKFANKAIASSDEGRQWVQQLSQSGPGSMSVLDTPN